MNRRRQRIRGASQARFPRSTWPTKTSFISANDRSQRGVAKWIIPPVVVFVAIVTVAYVFGTVVPPGSMGVRQIMFGPGQGYSTRALMPGYHWSLPSYSKVHILPANLRILNLSRADQNSHIEISPTRTFLDPIEIQTRDGASVETDYTVLNRIFPEASVDETASHGGPVELINNVGVSPQQWDRRIRTVVDDEVKRSLAQLSAAEFYDPDKRKPLEESAFTEARARLASFGIEVEALLLRRFTYGSRRIDEAIFEKNIQEIDERYNAAASVFAQAKAELEDVAARLDAEIETLKVRGERQVREIRSQGDLAEAQDTANGELLVAKARAEVDRQKADVLAQSAASSVYVARELAPLLSTLKGGVISGVDPYDLDAWMKRFGMVGEGQP